MEMERKDTGPKVIDPAENMDAEHNERSPQSTANKAMDKRELHTQMKKHETYSTMRLGWIL